MPKAKKAKRHRLRNKKPIAKLGYNTNNTESEIIAEKRTDRFQHEASNSTLVPDSFEYHFRVKKWEEEPNWLLTYFQNAKGADGRYRKANNTIENVTREKFRHDARPVGQIIQQPDRAKYFFTLGNPNTRSALAVLSDNNGNIKKQVLLRAYATYNGMQWRM
ncbi:hypothetical protein [Candidatus Cardinium hertigii]|uniref:Uncharacterized protein n=1 Tax=Candidatus Cardinium hertigii TaxID=247481 RepID=A0A2Z3L8F8_9BACT|nr:hypothetical protein [Candidatus Cardinium hertigii]AWN81699.1 hypothetical protein DK880_00371 [Candidatus Cardinium hertigii]